MRVVSVRVDDETKRRMERLVDVDWSEVIRNALRDRLSREEALRVQIDRQRAAEAGRQIGAFRASLAPSDFDSTKEIRKWRDRDGRS